MQTGSITHLRLVLVLFIVINITVNAQLDGFLEKLGGLTTTTKLLSNDKVVDGLRQALEIGTKNSVDIVSATNGYFKNEAIKIMLPDNIRKIEKTARRFGLSKQFDDMILAMNRAAENASKEALPIFTDALLKMNIGDGLKILNGADDEATKYFKSKTYTQLYDKFQPIVNTSMNKTGVVTHYNQIKTMVKKIPFVKIKMVDLDKYVTDKALDGLFHTLATEELKIRKDPAARVTDLLKDVFGGGK